MRREEQELLPGFPGGLVDKNPAANAGDAGSIPASRRSRKCWARGPRVLPCDKTRHQSEELRHRSEEKSFLSSAQWEESPWAARKTQHCPLSLRRVRLCDPIDSSSPPASLGSEEDPAPSVPQSCPTLWDHMDCSPPDCCVREILQVKILEWVARPSSRGSSPPRDRTQVSCIAGTFFTIWATREAHLNDTLL